MAFGRHTSGFNTDVGRYGRAITMFGSGLLALALGSVASAAPVLSFDSVTAVANGTTATPVQITVKVVNSGTAFDVNALSSALSWTVSGTGATVGDLFTLSDSGTVAGPGYLFNGAGQNPSLDLAPSNSGLAGWGVDAAANGLMQTGTTIVAILNLQVAAGVTSGTFNVSFPTSNPPYSFLNADFSPVAYTDGNNGTTTGVITVVPEPVATGYVATAGVVAAGLGFVQRRSRRSRRLAEVAG